MIRGLKILVGAGATCAAVVMLGFVIFAVSACQEAAPNGERADGIVVLTGAGNRIMVGGKLLAEQRGSRLLISGVNRKVRVADIRRLSQLDPERFGCCVDLGHEAQDTIGNAEETRKWAQHWGVRRLIVVTSSYHMLRSMTELRAVMPDAVLIPHPVVPPGLKERPWWLSFSLTRILLAEYLKLLPAAARFAAVRVLQPFTNRNDATHAEVFSR